METLDVPYIVLNRVFVDISIAGCWPNSSGKQISLNCECFVTLPRSARHHASWPPTPPGQLSCRFNLTGTSTATAGWRDLVPTLISSEAKICHCPKCHCRNIYPSQTCSKDTSSHQASASIMCVQLLYEFYEWKQLISSDNGDLHIELCLPVSPLPSVWVWMRSATGLAPC